MREELIQVRLVPDDFTAALSFYRALMEDAYVSGAPEDGYARIWSKSERPRTEIELFSGSMAAKVYSGPASSAEVTLVYVTDDVDAVVARLRDVGAEVVDGPEDAGPGTTRFARVRSPAGELVEVKTPSVPDWGSFDA